MALSEQEQRLLEQMEQALAAEDPKLAQSLRGTSVRAVHGRRALFAGIGLLLGVAVLVGGLELSPLVCVLGFVIMLASVVTGLSAFEASVGAQQDVPHGPIDPRLMDPRTPRAPRDPHGPRDPRLRRHPDEA